MSQRAFWNARKSPGFNVSMVNAGVGLLQPVWIASLQSRTYLRLDAAGTRFMSALTNTTTFSRPLMLGGLAAAILVAATVGLWAWYGTTVFFEVIRAGWLACF